MIRPGRARAVSRWCWWGGCGRTGRASAYGPARAGVTWPPGVWRAASSCPRVRSASAAVVGVSAGRCTATGTRPARSSGQPPCRGPRDLGHGLPDPATASPTRPHFGPSPTSGRPAAASPTSGSPAAASPTSGSPTSGPAQPPAHPLWPAQPPAGPTFGRGRMFAARPRLSGPPHFLAPSQVLTAPTPAASQAGGPVGTGVAPPGAPKVHGDHAAAQIMNRSRPYRTIHPPRPHARPGRATPAPARRVDHGVSQV